MADLELLRKELSVNRLRKKSTLIWMPAGNGHGFRPGLVVLPPAIYNVSLVTKDVVMILGTCRWWFYPSTGKEGKFSVKNQQNMKNDFKIIHDIAEIPDNSIINKLI
jgi:hypothetical protein